jgi:glutamyl-tRNA synthetase/glutamyl-Q tRNA(Asp) synthetase
MAATLSRLTRFAPAPTGWLHLGHVVNAIYVWGYARRAGAEVLLRIEDHDRERSRDGFEAALLDDLDWLGFEPDRFPTRDFRRGPCASRQRDRLAFYEHVAHALTDRGLVYGCTCTRQTLAALHASGVPGDGGRCRADHRAPGDGMTWRLITPDTVERFDDGRHGWVEQRPFGLHGDVAIRDRRGNWSYQFAVVADDHDQGIDLVIRGDDLLASTGLQIGLGRTIGRLEPARFLHHPLAVTASGRKLSKSAGDTGVRDLRAEGLSAADVIGRAAHLCGLSPTASPIHISQIESLFG